MSVDGSVPSSSSHTFAFLVGDMLPCLAVVPTFSQSEVNNMHNRLRVVDRGPHDEVIRLDVTVNEGHLVDLLNAANDLLCKHANRFQV